jgi:hypothetical protein
MKKQAFVEKSNKREIERERERKQKLLFNKYSVYV